MLDIFYFIKGEVYIFDSIISYFCCFVKSFIQYFLRLHILFQLFMVATQQSQIKSRTRSQLSLLGITCPNLKVLLSCACTPHSGNCSFFSNSFNRIFSNALSPRENACLHLSKILWIFSGEILLLH